MADFALFADIVPDFSRLKKDAKKEQIEVGVNTQGLEVGGGEEGQQEQTSLLGGMLSKLGAIAGVIGVLLQLETITALLQIIIGFINLGVVTLIKFIGNVVSFLADLPGKIADLALEVWGFISSALMDFLSRIPVIGGAFRDEDRQGSSRNVIESALNMTPLNPFLFLRGPSTIAESLRGGTSSLTNDSRQQVDVRVSADPTDRFFELTASVIEGTSRLLFS